MLRPIVGPVIPVTHKPGGARPPLVVAIVGIGMKALLLPSAPAFALAGGTRAIALPWYLGTWEEGLAAGGALRTIFRFTEALQQRTIQEVVDDIRKQLLADGKELVLLIEDLAALSGIQQPLLDIMIAESDEKGVRVRAPIRTAVAVTDGFLAGRQTVLTRAREQWVVPSEGIDEDGRVDQGGARS